MIHYADTKKRPRRHNADKIEIVKNAQLKIAIYKETLLYIYTT